ncbi:sensor histidine kinase [Archangium lipolyticum]|uniref:sensor histidine kinase n=1 Tax=Archangium lipolyticum TaxID=2970465 RepID=UPI00214A4551|nr:ATP-binding protein [Archangium lipolyticum]
MSSHRIATLLAVGLVTLVGSGARGAEPPGRVGFRSYGAEAGIENPDLLWILQDGEGFVWAGALDAVYRFDGTRFDRFGLEVGLPSGPVEDATLDAGGRLLLVTQGGVVRWEEGHFAALPMPGVPSPLWCVRLDSNKRMLVGTEQGLYVEAEPGRFVREPGWPGGPAHTLWVDASGALQVASGTRLLSRGTQARWLVREEVGGGGPILALVRDGSGRLWVSGDRWLLMQPRDGAPFEDRSALLEGARGSGRRLRVGRRGQLLVPTYRGLLEVEGERAGFLRLGLSELGARARDVLDDDEGVLWIASQGVQRALGRGLWTIHDASSGLPSNLIWGMARGPDGTLWVGTDSGLVRGTPEGWVPIPELRGHALKAVEVDDKGVVWASGNPGGLHRYEPWSGRLRTFDAASGFPARSTYGMTVEPDGTLWTVGTSGLVRGAPSGEGLSFETVLPASERTVFFGVIRDGAGRLWAAGDGLHVREGGVFRRLGTAEGLRDDQVRYLLARRDGRVCVSYFQPLGLSCFTYRDGKLADLVHLSRGMGLNNGVVYQIGEDSAGRLWVGTAAGVDVLDDKGRLEHHSASGGLPGDDCNGNSFLAEADGTVWVGTSNGLGRFEGAHYTGPAAPPRVTLLETSLGKRTLARPPMGGLEAEHDEATLEVRFADLGFVDEFQVEHEVRLVGLDDWHAFRGQSVRYSALAPGGYRFEARARNGRGEWGPVAGVDLRVHPPWWAAWWARSLGVLLLGAAVAGVVRWRGSRLQRRNAELVHLVEARTVELDEAREKVVQAEKLSAMGQLLARLSHEINNPLTAIHNNLPPVREYFELLSEALRRCRARLETHPEEVEELDRMWRELDLDYALQDTPEALEAMRYATERIRSTQADLRAFLRGERPRLESGDLNEVVGETVELVRRSQPHAARVEVHYGEVPRFFFHRGQLGQVVLNLLRNALEAMGAQGRVRVSTCVRDGMAELVVADEGPGVPAELRARIFEPFFTTKEVGTGLGLAICRQLITENHGGTFELDDSVPQGACFRVRLPLAQREREAA